MMKETDFPTVSVKTEPRASFQKKRALTGYPAKQKSKALLNEDWCTCLGTHCFVLKRELQHVNVRT